MTWFRCIGNSGEDEQIVNYQMLLDTSEGFLNECIDVTGGWNGITKGQVEQSAYYGWCESSASYSDVTIVKNPDAIRVEQRATSVQTMGMGVYPCIYTNNKVNTSAYNGLIAFISFFNDMTIKPTEDGMSCRIDLNDNCSTSTRVDTSVVRKSFNKYYDSGSLDVVCTLPLEQDYGLKKVICNLRYHGSAAGTQIAFTRGAKVKNVLLVKADDWQTLLSKAGISADSISAFLADSSKVTSLLNNEDAVKFMVKNCTGDFMVAAVQSNYFKRALKVSDYSRIVIENYHWSKFLGIVEFDINDPNYMMLVDTTSGLLNECTDVTGGWAAYPYGFSNGGVAEYTPFMSKSSSGLYIEQSAYNRIGSVWTEKKVPFSGQSGIFVQGIFTAAYYGDMSIGTSSAKESNYYANVMANYCYVEGSSQTTSKFFYTGSGGLEESRYAMFHIRTTGGVSSSRANETIKNAGVYFTDTNWSKLLTILGISGSMSVSDFLNDYSTQMLNDEAAVRFMLKLTGHFMITAINKSAFLTALESSPYKPLVLSNPHWSKFLYMVGVTA